MDIQYELKSDDGSTLTVDPTNAVLKVLTDAGLHVDASSGHEVERALRTAFTFANQHLAADRQPAQFLHVLDRIDEQSGREDQE